MLYIVIAFIFFIAPIPLFFDLSSFSFFLVKPDNLWGEDGLFAQGMGIPIPLSFISFIFYTLICLYYDYINPESTKTELINKNYYLPGFVFVFIVAIFFFLKGVSLVIIIQFIVPVIFLVLFAIPVNKDLFSIIRASYLSGIVFFSTLHLASIFIKNDFSFIGVDRYMNFGTFFGYIVYQSIVSYSATISLFLVFILWYWRTQSKNTVKSLMLLFFFAELMLLGLISEARLFVFDLLIIITAPFFMLYRVLLQKKIPVSLFVSLPLLITFIYLSSQNYGSRVKESGASDRVEAQTRAIREIFSDINYFFWGSGNIHSYAHNTLLNWILGFGFIFVIYYMYILFLGVKTMYIYDKNTTIAVQQKQTNISYFILLTAIVMTNSFFNSAITQPLFVGNAAIIYLIFMGHRRVEANEYERLYIDTIP